MKALSARVRSHHHLGGGVGGALEYYINEKLYTTVEKPLGSSRQFHVFHESSHLYSTVFSCANKIAQGFSNDQFAF